VSSPAVTYRVDDRRSADRATDAVMNSLGLRPGGFREALRTAILETAYNVADWAGSGEVALPLSGEVQDGEQRGVDRPLFGGREVAGSVSQPADVDGSDLFHQDSR